MYKIVQPGVQFRTLKKPAMRNSCVFYEFEELEEFLPFRHQSVITMKTLIGIILWCILFVLCWPLALILIILLPLIWLILLPFRIVGLTIDLVFKLVSAILLFPFRVMKSL